MEPQPPDPAWPRYASAPFPPYRYVPGRSPHPRRDPRGHSYGRPAPRAERVDPAAFRAFAPYLGAVDLYNFAYWWECHEAFEAFWQGAGKAGPEAQLFQGLIQVAAANLKRFAGPPASAHALARRGIDRLRGAASPSFGIDVAAFAREAEEHFFGPRPAPPLILLAGP